MVTVPDVTGEQEAEATITLHEAGFEVSTDQVENDIPEGEVIEQDPSADDARREGLDRDDHGQPRARDGRGAEGRRPAGAGCAAGAARTRASRPRSRSGRRSPSPTGKVIGSNPSQGSQHRARDRRCELIASTGVKTAVVPNVLGLDRVTATSQLRKAGFVVNANPRDSDEPEDQVLEQDPPAGEKVEVGTEVTIIYSSGVGTITLEDYVGQKLTYAQRKLAGRGPLGLGRQAATRATPPRTGSSSPRRRAAAPS